MNSYPTLLSKSYLWFVITFLVIIISCSKDSELLKDAILTEPSTEIVNSTDRETEEEIEEEESEGEEEELIADETETVTEKEYETRTTVFSTVHDAHVQSGKGYNLDIIRLEEGNRESYLMFDLSPIDSIGGSLEEVHLEFTITNDDGHGTILVLKGDSSNWSEDSITETTAPDSDTVLGSTTQDFPVNHTQEIVLDQEKIAPETLTLILIHEDGDDLAFASKEHGSTEGPKLVVTYSAPQDAEAIIEDGSADFEEPAEEENPGEENTDDYEDLEEGETGTEAPEASEEDEEAPSNPGNLNQAPEAVIKATLQEGTAPLTITFTGDNSSDDVAITGYDWNFLDGSTSNDPNPVHTFETPGEYKVTLTVKDEQGATDTATLTIAVSEKENSAPVAVASASVTTGEAPLEIQFKGSNSSDDKEVKNYFWDFKDGSTSTSSNPSHTFTEEGSYEVLLTVTDEEGLKDSETLTITITEEENEAPEAVASASPLRGDAPLNVQFISSKSTDDNGITGYFWDFKDGSTTTNQNPSHSFTEPGTYEVELSVKDEEGLTHSTTIEVVVNEPPVDNGGDDTDTGGDSGSDGDTGSEDTGGGSSEDGDTGNDNSGSYPSNAVFASDFGFNSSDGTDAIYKALNSGSSYVVIDKQSSDWIVSPLKLFRLSNMTIVFESGVVLKAKSGAFSSSGSILLNLVSPDNVTIEGNGAILKMNKSEYTTMENRHAFAINAGNNITVRNLTFRDSGGDGIYISGGSTSAYSQDITIENVTCENNRRQGMSIISAQNVWIKNSNFIGSSGAAPEAGVDLEPNSSSERLVNINFSQCLFTANDSFGFVIGTHKLTSSSKSISINVEDCEFKNNVVSPDSGVSKTELFISQGKHDDPVTGYVNFKNIKFNGSKYRIIKAKKAADAFKVTFTNCTASNIVTGGTDPAIELEAYSGEDTTGNINFDNFYLEYSKNTPFMSINAPSSGHIVKDISGSFTIKEPYDNTLRYLGGYDSSKNINVNIEYKHLD